MAASLTKIKETEIEKYYHIQIQKRNGEVSYALNLTEDRVRYIAEKFNNHKNFLIGGISIDPSDIANIEVSVTKDNSDTILKKEIVERGFFRVKGGIETFIFEMGKVITSDYIKQQPDPGKKENNEEANKASYDPKKIFIVHGHQDLSKLELARLLEGMGLEPIILHEQPNEGKAVFEKFEKYTSDIGYAFVLLTPDDVGHSKNEDDKAAKDRARQNVILELGYLMAKLGKDRVCCLYEKSLELPSDILGILYIKYEKIEYAYYSIVRELHKAGYMIKVV